MVADLGPLDPGPVWGGYIAAVLLASAYLSIGLCVSALSENQIVSLIIVLRNLIKISFEIGLRTIPYLYIICFSNFEHL